MTNDAVADSSQDVVPTTRQPQVFISYTHEGRAHHEQVAQLARLLKDAGVHPVIDQSEEEFADGLPLWMIREIETADFVLVVCTETYARVVLTGDTSNGGRGALFEFFQLANHIHTHDSRNTKVIPVGFGPHNLAKIPTLLQPALYYDVSTSHDFEQLIHRLRRVGSPESPTPETAAAFIEANRFSDVPPEFRSDVALLAEFATRNFKTRIRRGTFNIDNTPIHFDREVSKVLATAASRGSLLLTGEPGSGKSGLIQQLCDETIESGRDVVYFDVERNDAATPYDLRKRIGLQHEIDDVLAAWPGIEAGYLFIDALDALRSGESVRAFRDLLSRIALSAPRWTCVVAIRSYDLSNSPSLRSVFPPIDNDTIPSTFQEPLYGRARHIAVDRLTNADLNWLAERSNNFRAFYERASDNLTEVIRNPFNLSLAATILDSNKTNSELHAVGSELDLLDLYWQYRIIEQERASTLEHCLASIANEMINSRALFAARLAITDAASLDVLLQLGILTEFDENGIADRYRVSFRHAILFDYAIQRVIFRANAKSPLDIIERDRDKALFLQPSLRFYFLHLWYAVEDRAKFWPALSDLCASSSAPEFIKLHASILASSNLRHPSELGTLFAAPTSSIELIFTYLVRALGPNSREIFSSRSTLWLTLLSRVVADAQTPSHECYLLLDQLRGESATLDSNWTVQLNRISRSLLSSAIAREPRHDWYVRVGLLGILKTYASDKSSSKPLIRKLLSKQHLRVYGFRDAPVIAGEIAQIFAVDPKFATTIYKLIFGHVERSRAKTSLGSSRIFGFSSNRAQDYNMAHFELGRAFPAFLNQHPSDATAALCAVLETYEKRIFKPQREIITFSFRSYESQARLVFAPDGDRIDDPFRHDDQLQMIDAFDKYCAEIAEVDEAKVDAVLDSVARHSTTGYLPRRLLLLGARFPNAIGHKLFELLASSSVLTFYDTREASSRCLEATFPLLSAEAKKAIEKVITTLPSGAKGNSRTFRLRVRDDLLQALSDEDIVQPKTRRLRAEAKKERLPPTVVWHGTTATEYTVLDAYDEEVGTVGAPDALRDSIASVENIWRLSLNRVLDKDAIDEFLPNFLGLRNLLAGAEASDRFDFAWSVLAAGVSKIVQSPAASRSDKETCLPILVAASYQNDPKPDHDHDKQFNSSQSWGSPSARIDAVLGLLHIHREFPEETTDPLRRLSTDQRAVIRFLVARWLGHLVDHKLSWRMATVLARDSNRGVLSGLLDTGLKSFFGRDWQRTMDLVWSIYDRVKPNASGAPGVRKLCMLYFVSASVYHNDPKASEALAGILRAPEQDLPLAKALIECYLNTAKQSKPDDNIRKTCLARVVAAAEHCRATYTKLIESCGPWGTWADDAIKSLKAVFGLSNFIAERIFFMSGAVGTIGAQTRELDPDFFEVMLPAIETLSIFPEPNTVQHIVQTISAFAIVAPKRLFGIGARAIRSGVEGGYALEYMGADAVAAFVQLYLADFRELLESDAKARADLMDILDIFVKAGWPQMNKIVDDLQVIFR